MFRAFPTTMSSRTGSWSTPRRSPTASGSLPPTEAELAALETRLQALLDPYRDRLEPVEVYGQPFLRRPGATKHEWFAGVNRNKGVVRLSLLPMYRHPELLEGLSPALLKRRTGASLFTFATIDDAQ